MMRLIWVLMLTTCWVTLPQRAQADEVAEEEVIHAGTAMEDGAAPVKAAPDDPGTTAAGSTVEEEVAPEQTGTAGVQDNGGLATAHDRAGAAMERGDYAMAYCAWRPLAEAGEVEAQYALGWMYHNGYGLAIDDRAAESWWKKASAQGHVEAAYSLGALYSVGSDMVPRDFLAALDHWAEAAAAGHEHASKALRDLVARGIPEVEQASIALLAKRPGLFGEVKEVRVGRANLRQGPGTRNRIIKVIERGSPVVEFLRREDWVKIGVGDPPAIGWIFSTLIGEREQLAAETTREIAEENP